MTPSVVAVFGGNPKGFSARPYEPLNQDPKRMTTNFKEVHVQYTNRSNLRQALSHMADGLPVVGSFC